MCKESWLWLVVLRNRFGTSDGSGIRKQQGLSVAQFCRDNGLHEVNFHGWRHRYKGLALRKNIAASFREHATAEGCLDPWQAMFDYARDSRSQEQSDRYPFRISPDGCAKIEPHIPLLPHSREVIQILNLQRFLVLYRMVFGQNRQEDLIKYLQSRFTKSQISELIEICRIDLSPPTCVGRNVPSAFAKKP